VNPGTEQFGLGGFGRIRISYIRDRKDLAMRNQRSFNIEFKRQVVKELLSRESRPAQLLPVAAEGLRAFPSVRHTKPRDTLQLTYQPVSILCSLDLTPTLLSS